MKVVLLNPPQCHPLAPPISLPSLTAYLRQDGIQVLQIDASIGAYRHLLSTDVLVANLRRCQQILSGERDHRVTRTQALGFLKQRGLEISKLSDQQLEGLVASVADAVEHGQLMTDPNGLDRQMGRINMALLLSSISYLPTWVALGNWEAIPNLIGHDEQNPILEYYRNEVVPEVLAYEPDLVGVAYGYARQVTFGISLTKELRRAGLRTPIVAGGHHFTAMSARCMKQNNMDPHGEGEFCFAGPTEPSSFACELRSMLHPMGIRGEGEGPLLELCRRIRESASWHDVRGLVMFHGSQKKLHISPAAPPIPADSLPVPDLAGLAVTERYLSPIGLAPAMTSRGCYWNKCTFCDLTATLGSDFRSLSRATVLETLQVYRSRHGIDAIFFCDECISPAMVRFLGDEAPKMGLDQRYWALARFAKSLLQHLAKAHEAGFRMLSFGIESGCGRIVELMNKGYRHEDAQAIIDECGRVGIAVACSVMFGFPSETREEARETISFLEKNADKISVIRLHFWFFTFESPIGRDPAKYGIVPADGRTLSPNPRDYVLKSGIGREEAQEFVRRVAQHPTLGPKVVFAGILEDFRFVRGILEERVKGTRQGDRADS